MSENKLTNGFVVFTKEEMDLLTQVSPTALAMYFHLKKRVNNKRGDNMAFPGGKTLLRELGYSPKSKGTLSKATRELESIGLIRVDRRYDNAKQTWAVNNYFLTVGVVSKERVGAEESIPGATENQGVVPQNDHNKEEVNYEEVNNDYTQELSAQASQAQPSQLLSSQELEEINNLLDTIPHKEEVIPSPQIALPLEAHSEELASQRRVVKTKREIITYFSEEEKESLRPDMFKRYKNLSPTEIENILNRPKSIELI